MSGGTKESHFHGPAERYYRYADRAVEKALNTGRITPDDAAYLREFIGEISVDMTPQRRYKYFYILINWRTFIGPFGKNTAGDIFTGIDLLKRYKDKKGKPYSSHTLVDYFSFIKRFYEWMIESGYSSIPLKKIEKIKVPKPDQMTVTAEGLITEEEILKMIETCWHSRDRAIISLLCESGFRISEVGTLQWNQIKFTDWNCTVNTAEKTGKPRRIPLVKSRAYLAQWKNDYPEKITGDSYVFLTLNTHKPIQYRGLQKKIIKIAEKAGVKRKINPHLFRHSRITDLINKGYSESSIKLMMWGNLSTPMLSCYAHLSAADIDREVARHEGIITEDAQKDSPLEARQCPQCYTVNGPTMAYCHACGLALTKEAAADTMRLKQIIDGLSNDQIIELLTKSESIKQYNQGATKS